MQEWLPVDEDLLGDEEPLHSLSLTLLDAMSVGLGQLPQTSVDHVLQDERTPSFSSVLVGGDAQADLQDHHDHALQWRTSLVQVDVRHLNGQLQVLQVVWKDFKEKLKLLLLIWLVLHYPVLGRGMIRLFSRSPKMIEV